MTILQSFLSNKMLHKMVPIRNSYYKYLLNLLMVWGGWVNANTFGDHVILNIIYWMTIKLFYCHEKKINIYISSHTNMYIYSNSEYTFHHR